MTSFESSATSTVLSWICVGPMLLALAFAPFSIIRDAEAPLRYRILVVWLLLCLIALSPLRYVFFQLVLAASFPVQSWRAFFSGILVLMYAPIVFGILYLISLGIPLAGTVWIAGAREDSPRWRTVLAGFAAPALCAAAWIPFSALLPLAAKTVHWLDPVSLVRATNGPSYYVFKYIVLPATPLQFPFPGEEASQFKFSDRDLARLHVASVYMSAPREGWFIREAYPELYTHLEAQRSQR